MNWIYILLVCVGLSSCHSTEAGLEDGKQKGLIEWIHNLIGASTSTTSTAKPSTEPPKDCPTCQCGIARTHRRIVGGTETKQKEYPWMCALLYGGRFYCGCSLISDLYVITAAHCTTGSRKEGITVRFLDHDLDTANETKTINRKVEAIIRHIRYNPGTYDNDIAMLKLDQRLDLSSAIKKRRSDRKEVIEEERDRGVGTVCLPEPLVSYSGYNATVAGWGTTEEGGHVSNVLREVFVPIISNEECRKTNYMERITDNMLCAGTEEGGKDACQGDSGGPLHVFNNVTNTWLIAGVVSWGEGCARPKTPGVYSRVNKYLTWIKSNTKDACYCSEKFIKKY